MSLTVNGEERILRLSLGALAELEERIGAEGLMALVERFEQASFRSADLIALLHAGLREGGWEGSEEDLRRAHVEGGAMAAAHCAARLLRATFTLEP